MTKNSLENQLEISDEFEDLEIPIVDSERQILSSRVLIVDLSPKSEYTIDI